MAVDSFFEALASRPRREILAYLSAQELTAGEIASRDVVEAFPDEPLAELAARMARRAVTHALVLGRAGGRPVGIISTLDVARVLAWGRA